MINWTITGTPAYPDITNRRLGVLSNASWPFSSLDTVDYESNIAVTFGSVTPSSTGVAYGTIIMAADMRTGQLLWNITTDMTTGQGGAFNGSTACADHGKFVLRLNDGHWHCWDLYSGRELWISETTSWPWGTFGDYGISSYGGNIIYPQYDGVVAYNWSTGKVSWNYSDRAISQFEIPYTDETSFINHLLSRWALHPILINIR